MTAKPSDWKHLPFEGMVPLPYCAAFDDEQFERLSDGLIPRAMEDKWFVYLDNNLLCFHRSWTGQGIYQVVIVHDGERHTVADASCSAKFWKGAISNISPNFSIS